MPKRPLIITIFTVCYFLSPFVILIHTSMISNIPLFGPNNIFNRLFFTDIIILSIYPVCALALYSVRKWGWYIFLGSSITLISYNTIVYCYNPLYNLAILISFNIALAVIAGIFFRKHIIAPYFNPRLRWWETDPRYRLEISAEIKSEVLNIQGEILDISTSGCLIVPDATLSLGKIHTISINCMSHFFDVHGKIMRRSSSDEEFDRYGIMFVRLSENTKYQLNMLIKVLEMGGLRDYFREQKTTQAKEHELRSTTRITETASRYSLSHTAVLSGKGKDINCQLLDISERGCYIRTPESFSVSQKYRVTIICMNQKTSVKGVIEWAGESEKPGRYGVKFIDITKEEKKNLMAIIRVLIKFGAYNRTRDAHPVSEEVFDRSVAHTPYRVVLFLKKLILKDVG